MDDRDEPLSLADTNIELSPTLLNRAQMEGDEENKPMQKHPGQARQAPLAIRFRSAREIHPGNGNYQDNIQLLKQKMQRNR